MNFKTICFNQLKALLGLNKTEDLLEYLNYKEIGQGLLAGAYNCYLINPDVSNRCIERVAADCIRLQNSIDSDINNSFEPEYFYKPDKQLSKNYQEYDQASIYN